jgi:hypothetical protein
MWLPLLDAVEILTFQGKTTTIKTRKNLAKTPDKLKKPKTIKYQVVVFVYGRIENMTPVHKLLCISSHAPSSSTH